MEGYGPGTYGERWADVYDAWVGTQFNDAATLASVDLLADLADLAAGGRVLELAIGTGRVALPLAERGLEVHGIDASEAMVAKPDPLLPQCGAAPDRHRRVRRGGVRA
jgi:cyclopropane fatty-acyl-phospholipid synthase-like methyltransferase